MGGIFGGGDAPAIQPAPVIPSEDPAKLAEQAAAAEEARKRSDRGRASTLLTAFDPLGGASDSNTGVSAKNVLLGGSG